MIRITIGRMIYDNDKDNDIIVNKINMMMII